MDADNDIGGLRCGEVLARLSDFLDGTLSEDEHAKVSAHVRACNNCERFGGAFAVAVRALRGLQRSDDVG